MLEAVVLALATFRITRLIVKDQIFNPLRDWIWNKYPPTDEFMRPKTNIGYLISCPHCTSIWVALTVYTCYTIDLTRVITIFACSVLALSAIAGWLAQLDDRF